MKSVYSSSEFPCHLKKSGGSIESPSAVRLVDELKSSRSGPKGLQVEQVGLRILEVYHADYFHFSRTFRASQGVHLPGSSPGLAPIFGINLA